MAIKPKFTGSDIHKELIRRSKLIETAIINRLKYLGELCLTECRTNKTYTDQTGNLTASMGYLVLAHGKVVGNDGFSGSGDAGPQQGKSLANDIAAQHKNGYALI